MVNKKISLLAHNSNKPEDILKNYYKSWRIVNREANAPFLALYNSFKDKYLASLEAGPLRLYLYFAFHANNESGHSWHSVQTIAKFFDAQTRTIDNWIKVLVDQELIYRERTDKVSNTTFLIPYSDTILPIQPSGQHENEDQQLVDDVIEQVKHREFVYGKIVAVTHLFQWKKEKKRISTKSRQMLLINTVRKNGVSVYLIYTFRKLTDYGVETLDIHNMAIFKSPFKYHEHSIKGIAIDPEIPMFNGSNPLLDLCKEVGQAKDEDFSIHPEIQYGLIKNVLVESDTTKD